ncbi:MAG: hypothetical protein KA375_15715 [Vitreoscilla sp.]|nr:hypothetical protein [Burkholderiales bacterium]MBP6339045.1 hypothetical protein [Vitreoscilla sp.]MBP6676118.1 hypothetical protein [Vitreoscilla sp.]
MTAITSQTFHVEPALPRFARALADVVHAGARLLAAAWTATADTPADAAGDAERVRAMARAWEKTDPGFAADLYAAAARHEGQDR